LGLDPQARKSVWNYIEKLKKEKTILLTTHYLEEADSLADRIAIMDNGEIIAIGTSGELKHRYMTSKTLKISAENITAEIVDILSKQGMEVNLTSLGVEIKSKELDFNSIINLFQKKNIKIRGIEMQEPTLDDVFLHLTGKEETI
jgi:ABC-2 type transport system ATP-binding protein